MPLLTIAVTVHLLGQYMQMSLLYSGRLLSLPALNVMQLANITTSTTTNIRHPEAIAVPCVGLVSFAAGNGEIVR